MGGAISNGVVGLTAVWAGMTAGASASTISNHGHLVFKLMMFGVPVALILLGTLIFFKKVTLDEKEHARIVDELERTWGKTLAEDDATAEVASEQAVTVMSPIDGQLVPLASVNDENFASGKMGAGFAIKPSDGRIYAPFDGKVKATFPTRHAVGLVADNGLSVLIHIGIDTVNMRGTGFVSYVEQDQVVKQGDLLIEFWQPALEKAGYDDTVMVVVTDTAVQPVSLNENGTVTHGDPILKIES